LLSSPSLRSGPRKGREALKLPYAELLDGLFCCWQGLFWCRNPPKALCGVGRRHGRGSRLHRKATLEVLHVREFVQKSHVLPQHAVLKHVNSFLKVLFLLKPNLFILQLSIPPGIWQPPDQGDALGNAPGLPLPQGLPRPGSIQSGAEQFIARRSSSTNRDDADPVASDGLLQCLVCSSVFCRSISFSPGSISSRSAVPAAIMVERCSFNPGSSLGLIQMVSDQSFPQEGQGGCLTLGIGQHVLEEVVYKRKRAKAGSSTELTASNSITQVLSDLVTAIIQAKSQLSPYGALISKLNPCKQVG